MQQRSARTSSVIGATLVTLTMAPRALADEAVVVIPPAVERTVTTPNRYLLNSGLFTLGAAYLPALAVAVQSDRPEDEHLYAPVAGPWLDLADREECVGDCDSETVNKVLLVTSGVFQGLGALQILGALVFPETRTITVRNVDGSPAIAMTVTPASFDDGANGFMAAGEF
jgi:hypothetical protein